jgi:hypothetical protein
VNKAQRAEIQKVQAILVAHRGRVGYRQLRPMTTRNVSTVTGLMRKLGQGFDMDCSESGVLICHVAGVKSPTGSWAYGNTETYLQHLTNHYFDARDALPGAFAVLNSDRPLTEQHLVQCHEADHAHGDPIIFTHGTAADPRFMKLSWIQAGFSGRTTWLSVKRL